MFEYASGNSLLPNSGQVDNEFCVCAFTETKFLGNGHGKTCQTLQRPTLTREKSATQRIISLQASHADKSRTQLYSVDQRSREPANLPLLTIINHCRRALTDTSLSRACEDIVGKRHIKMFTSICIRDLEVTLIFINSGK